MTLKPMGPYVLLERLAAGGMARVYVAKRLGPMGFEKLVAVKRMLPHLSRDPDFVRMFVDEARLAAQLHHPNIVNVFDFGLLDGQLFQAMEFVRGTSVSRLLRAARRQAEKVDPACAVYIASCVLRALEHAHALTDRQGKSLEVVHRDVSPPNVLLSAVGEVKLGDFGIARLATRQSADQRTHIWGKVGYVSPEQVRGEAVDPRTDVFATGVVLAELLMGRRLFVANTQLETMIQIRDGNLSRLQAHEAEIPSDVWKVLQAMLATDRHERVATAGMAADALEETLRRHQWMGGQRDVAELQSRLGIVPPGVPIEAVAAHTRPPEDESSVGIEPEEATPISHVPSDPFQAEPGRVDSDGRATPMFGQATYQIRLTSGQTVGPLGFAKTVELLTTARIDGETLISLAGDDFVPAREIAHLRRFITAEDFCWDGDEVQRASHRKSIAPATVPRLTARLIAEGATAVVHVKHGARRKKVYFVEGAPVAVHSTDPRELLGEVLVAAGLCTHIDVEMAMAFVSHYDDSLGDALVELGVLDKGQVRRCTQQQVKARFLELFRWRRGELAVTYDVRNSRAEPPADPISPEPETLIAEGIRACYHVAELEALLDDLREDVLSPHPEPRLRLEAFGLPESALAVLKEIDGRRTLASVLARQTLGGGSDPEEVYQALFLGLCAGLIVAG